MISLDQTLIFQVIGFFALMFILNQLLFKPVLRILEERRERIDGALKKASETEKDVQKGIEDYKLKLKEAAIKGNEERNRLRQIAQEKEKELLGAARAEASRELSSMRQDLGKSKDSALADLRERTRDLSRDIAEKILERGIVVLLVALSVPFLPTLCHAAEEAHEGGAAGTWKIINFIILAIGVYLIWTKGIKGLLEKRGTDIEAAIAEADAARDEAEKKVREYQEKLSALDGKVAEIHNELRLEGEAEKERMIKEAAAAAEALKEQARITAEQELKKARFEIQKEVASMATRMATELLARELKPEDQARLINGYLDNLRLN